MAAAQKFPILIATDGSAAARAAIRVAARFPWPAGVEVHAIVAREARPELRRSTVWSKLDDCAPAVVKRTAAALQKRWPDATVRVSDALPGDAIVKEARRIRARVIVIGWRGHGAVRRLLTGSVSRDVVRRAGCAVLVVRRFRKRTDRLVLGYDDSIHARHAVDLLASLQPPPQGRVTVLNVVDTMRVPTQVHLTAETRAIVREEVDRINGRRMTKARRLTESAAAKLAVAGWNAGAKVTMGAPLWELLGEAYRSRADVLVVGARGVSGMTRLVLGSVAEAALNRSTVPVLIVR